MYDQPYGYTGTEGVSAGVSSISLAVGRGGFSFTSGSISRPSVSNCLVHLLIIYVYCEAEGNVSPLTLCSLFSQSCENFLHTIRKGKFGFNLRYPPHPFLI